MIKTATATTILVYIIGAGALLSGADDLNINQFDPACGQPGHNCRSAFVKAFEAAKRTGPATIHLPPGTFPIDFPEVVDNVPTGWLYAASLIVVPPGVTIQGALDSNGFPASTIEWKITSIPVFIFAGSSYSGMRDLHLRFTGKTPKYFPFGDVSLLSELGYSPEHHDQNKMSGGNYEMSSFLTMFNSEHCTFQHLIFDSGTHDNEHVFGFAFNIKGGGAQFNGTTAGLSALTKGNRLENIEIYDDLMGMLIAGQDGVVIQHIKADRRGSTNVAAPGHVIYFTVTNLYHKDGKTDQLLSRDVQVRDIKEGSHTYSNTNSLGTLAIKYVDGGRFDEISSEHPLGLIQSLSVVKNVTFAKLAWSDDQNFCEDCNVPVIETVGSSGGIPSADNVQFSDITLKSTHRFITANFIGQNISVDRITIETPPEYVRTKNRPHLSSALSIRDAENVNITRFTYTPVIKAVKSDAEYNQPLVCWNVCANVHANVTVRWPAHLALPALGHNSITSAIQIENLGHDNSTNTRIERY